MSGRARSRALTKRHAFWRIGSNTATGSISRERSRDGWRAPARSFSRDADVIVPVPMHRSRIWKRRFNQAALLADGIARRSGKRVDAFALARKRPTRPQVGLSRAERQSNLSGAFEVAEEASARVAGLRVLLVDDVLTTGATANAAARALLRGGAEAVDVLVFARVVHDGVVHDAFATT